MLMRSQKETRSLLSHKVFILNINNSERQVPLPGTQATLYLFILVVKTIEVDRMISMF